MEKTIAEQMGPLVFGTLPMGHLQAGMTPDEGGRLIAHALAKGIKAVDTAEMYGTYRHIKRGIEIAGKTPFIITKTHAADKRGAREHLERALSEMGVERLDVANVHGARLEDPIGDRSEVIEEILKMKSEGKIGRLGLSTHRIAVAEKALQHPEIEIIHPLINKSGLGIIDGPPQRMADAISALAKAGRTIYAMKALAGGNLIANALENINHVRSLPGIHAVAIGMLSETEINANAELFLKNTADPAQWATLSGRKRKLAIMKNFCTGCGTCVETCSDNALTIENGVATVDEQKCVLCGYCAAACPAFLLRVI